MPTPIGHALAGLTIAWLANAHAARTVPAHAGGVQSRNDGAVAPSSRALAVVSAVSAVLPDVDVLFGMHRTWTHSLGAALAFTLLVAAVAAGLRWRVGPTAIVCGLAFTSHVLLDALGKDTADPRGVMAFWPLSRTFFISGVDLFAEVSRRYWRPDEFIWGNLRSVTREIITLGPPAIASGWLAWKRSRGRRAASRTLAATRF